MPAEQVAQLQDLIRLLSRPGERRVHVTVDERHQPDLSGEVEQAVEGAVGDARRFAGDLRRHEFLVNRELANAREHPGERRQHPPHVIGGVHVGGVEPGDHRVETRLLVRRQRPVGHRDEGVGEGVVVKRGVRSAGNRSARSRRCCRTTTAAAAGCRRSRRDRPSSPWCAGSRGCSSLPGCSSSGGSASRSPRRCPRPRWGCERSAARRRARNRAARRDRARFVDDDSWSCSEEDRERRRERRALLAAHVVAKRAADRRAVHINQLHVQPDVAGIAWIDVHPDQVFGALIEASRLVAEDL